MPPVWRGWGLVDDRRVLRPPSSFSAVCPSPRISRPFGTFCAQQGSRLVCDQEQNCVVIVVEPVHDSWSAVRFSSFSPLHSSILIGHDGPLAFLDDVKHIMKTLDAGHQPEDLQPVRKVRAGSLPLKDKFSMSLRLLTKRVLRVLGGVLLSFGSALVSFMLVVLEYAVSTAHVCLALYLLFFNYGSGSFQKGSSG